MALVGAGGDHLVTDEEGRTSLAGAVDVPAAAADGEDVEAGLDAEPERAQRLPRRPTPLGDRHPHDDVVGLAEGEGEDRVELLLLLDEPHHLLGLVAEVLGGLGQVEQAAQR